MMYDAIFMFGIFALQILYIIYIYIKSNGNISYYNDDDNNVDTEIDSPCNPIYFYLQDNFYHNIYNNDNNKK